MNEWSLSELEQFTEGKNTGLVYLYTPFCGTCQISEKMLSVAEKVINNIIIGKININYIPMLAEKWMIESVPCLVFVQNGTVVHKIYAFQSVPYLVETIHSIINL